MVLDPISALSLGGTIIQFVDFTSKIVCKGNQIRAKGAAADNIELESATVGLVEITSRLQDQMQTKCLSKALTPDDILLDDLTKTCIEVATILLDKLRTLKVPNGVKNRRWKSLRQALKTVWDKKNLDAFVSKLGELKSQLILGVLLTLKNDLNLAKLQEHDQYNLLSEQSRDLLLALASNQDKFAGLIDSQTRTITRSHQETFEQIVHYQEALPNRVAEALQKSILDNTGSKIVEHHMEQIKLQKEAVRKHNAQVDRALLRRLKFSTMNDRYERVADAHARTFEWIFRDPKTWNKPWDDFSDWLSSGNGVYWISGKAGSGKSTLMRYLVENPRSKALLAQWAGTKRLTVAEFFFWNGGASDQASQGGLLRSLLHELLSKLREDYPDLVRLIFPNEWVDAEDAVMSKNVESDKPQEPLTLRRLQTAFRSLIKQDVGRICLFIDGLDEYEGDFFEAINLFQESATSNIKLCLSSRPWVVFEQAFAQRPKLRLQDLTYEDIELYVNDKLLCHPRIRSLSLAEPAQAPLLMNLLREIVTKASGVFLWVMLVVRDLLKGLTNYDKLPALQRRLEVLPSEIRELYSVMLGQIDSDYLREGSRILQMMSVSRSISKKASKNQQRCSEEALCAVGLSFVLEEEPSLPDVELINFLTPEQVSERVAEVDRRLKVCCSGLLEISSHDQAYFKYDRSQDGVLLQESGNTKIQYLHRTVKDFIESDEMQLELRRHSRATTFNPHASLIISSVLRLRKCISPSSIDVEQGVKILGNIVEWCMLLAHENQAQAGCCDVEVLDELERAASILWEHLMRGSFVKNFSSEILTGYLISTPGWHDDFLSLATFYNLHLYLGAKLGSDAAPARPKSAPQYLEYAVAVPLWQAESAIPCVKTLETLCRYDARPNERCFRGPSLWETILHRALQAASEESRALQWAPVLELLLRHGAGLDHHRAHRPYLTEFMYTTSVYRWTPIAIKRIYLPSMPEVANLLLQIRDEQVRKEEERLMPQVTVEIQVKVEQEAAPELSYYRSMLGKLSSIFSVVLQASS